MNGIQWISASLGVVIAFCILNLVRRDQLHTRDGIRWILLAVAIFVLGFIPQVVDWVGETLGISYPPIIVVLTGMGVLLIKLLINDTQRASMRIDIERLVQKVAMLENELNKVKNDKRQ